MLEFVDCRPATVQLCALFSTKQREAALVSQSASTLEPIFISVKQAAQMLGISIWVTRRLLDDGVIDSRYQGRRRLVSVESLREYAANLPMEGPAPTDESA